MPKVEGTQSQILSSTPYPTGSSTSNRFMPRVTPTSSQYRKEGRCNVKIVQAEMSVDEFRKPAFNKLGQVFIDLSETTANINYVSSVVQQKFGIDYIVVTADGLKVDDSSGTQGTSH